MKTINKTISLLVKHAVALKNWLDSYHYPEATSLLNSLNSIIEKLENPMTSPSAGLDLLIFTICLLPGNRLSLTSKRVRMAVYLYYHTYMREEIIDEFINIKEKMEDYEVYRDKISKQVQMLNEKMIYLDKVIDKNTYLIIDLNNSLTANYRNLITDIALITEKNVSIYKNLKSELTQCEMENLSHNKRIFEIKNQFEEKISILEKSGNFFQKPTSFAPIAEIIDKLVKFTEEINDEKIHDFICIKNNSHEIGILEWLIQNHFISGNIGERSKKEKDNALIKGCIAKLKENLIVIFAISGDVNTDRAKAQLGELDKISQIFIDKIRNIRADQFELSQQLLLLKDSIKDANLYTSSKKEFEEIDSVQNKRILSTTFGDFFQIFSPHLNRKEQQVDAVKESVDDLTQDLVQADKPSVSVSAESTNDENEKTECLVM